MSFTTKQSALMKAAAPAVAILAIFIYVMTKK